MTIHEPFHSSATSSTAATSLPSKISKNIKSTNDRSSFSSVREQDGALAQAFTKSRTSSLLAIRASLVHPDSDAASTVSVPSIVHDDSIVNAPTPAPPSVLASPLTMPFSRLHAVWTDGTALPGWKEIHVRGRTASRSFADLSSWYHGLFPSGSLERPVVQAEKPPTARLNTLPPEILLYIINIVATASPTPSRSSGRSQDVTSLMLTCRFIHTLTVGVMYHHVVVPHSRMFRKFLAVITVRPDLGALVHRLDFSHFNPLSLFISASERARTANLTQETLLRCLALTPNLRQFLAQEHVDNDIGPDILCALLLSSTHSLDLISSPLATLRPKLSSLQAIDFAGCSSASFRDAFSAILSEPWPDALTITRLSLHRCTTLHSTVFEKLLSRLPHVTHLDLACTRLTDAGLFSLPHTARLSHLNVAKCPLLTPNAITTFVSGHPATRALQFLSLASDSAHGTPLESAHVSALLVVLPTSLRSLSLRGSRMNFSHISLLEPLTTHLEELAVGRGLHIDHLRTLFTEPREPGRPAHTVHYLDLSDLTDDELYVGSSFIDQHSLFHAALRPLEVLELAEGPHRRLAASPTALRRAGWTVAEIMARSWIVRAPHPDVPRDSGHRPWKLGAESWGMHKVPMAEADVGGVYGMLMFGRKF